jgi:2'-5' RNA ligase
VILTLQLDSASARYFSDLRRQYFPPALNFLPAHITLFRHLPGNELDTAAGTLEQLASGYEVINIRVDGLRSLGRGVAYSLESEQLSTLRSRLVRQWSPWLTPQDRQPFNPHITVQNKVHPDEAHKTLPILSAVFTPHTITGIGLDLWRYLGGLGGPFGSFSSDRPWPLFAAAMLTTAKAPARCV